MKQSSTLEDKQITLSTEIDCVRLLLKNELFAAKYSDHLKAGLFREQLRPIVEISVKYWQQYRKLCPNNALVQELEYKIGTGFTEEKKTSILQMLYQLSAEPQTPIYTEDQIANFIRFQKIENALVESIKIIDEADKKRDVSRLDEIAGLVNKASQKLELKKPTFLLSDAEARMLYRDQLASGELNFDGFGTGVPGLDDLRMPSRGLRAGEIGMFVAATGRGKSIALTNCAFTAAIRGHKVVYFSLELPEEMLLDRADAMATQVFVNDVVAQRKFIREKLQEMEEETGLGEIVFKELPCTGVNVINLKNELTQLQQVYDFEPRLIVVDYIDLMLPMQRIRNQDGWKTQQVVTQEVRALGGEWNCAIWTASQGNRSAAQKNDDGKMVEEGDTAESYLKLGVVDWAITINRTKKQMALPDPKPAVLNVIKNRTGISNRTVGILTDFRKMQFYIGDYDDSPEQLSEESMGSGAFKVKK